MSKTPKCFISYSWDSEEHKEWVRILAERLVQNGVETSLDQWDISLGDQIPLYMEKSVREADFVLLVCTPKFASKANDGKGGVGYETGIVTGEIFVSSASNRKFIPILKGKSPKESLPSYLKSKAYLDFRDNDNYETALEELLRHIYEEPKFKRPPLGKKPLWNAKSISYLSKPEKDKAILPEQKKVPMRGRDLQMEVSLSFQESLYGIEKDIEYKHEVICSRCHGSGVEADSNTGVCKNCNGHGLQQQVIRKKVQIPAGVDSGTQIRLNGEGGLGKHGGENGNLYLVLSVKPHPFYKRENLNLLLLYPISEEFANRGGNLQIPLVEKGNFVSLYIPPHTKNMQSFIVNGEGVRNLRGKDRGNIIVTVEVYNPNNITKETRDRLNLLGL